jgi:hypothetical protein
MAVSTRSDLRRSGLWSGRHPRTSLRTGLLRGGRAGLIDLTTSPEEEAVPAGVLLFHLGS